MANPLRTLASLFTGYNEKEDPHANSMGIGASGISGGEDLDSALLGMMKGSSNKRNKKRPPGMVEHKTLPRDRHQQYAIFAMMYCDGFVRNAIDIQLTEAFAPKTGGNSRLALHSNNLGPAHDYIIEGLQDKIIPMLDKQLPLASNIMATNGASYARIYGQRGAGVTALRCDFETLPYHMRRWERAGQVVGYTNDRQMAFHGDGKHLLMAPWAFAEFRTTGWIPRHDVEPFRVDALPPNLANDDLRQDPIYEAQNYGLTNLAGAYKHWLAITDGINAIRMSRAQSTKLDRFAKLHLGDLDINQGRELQQMLENVLTAQRNQADAQAVLYGAAPAINNTVIPVMEGGKGDVDFHMERMDPNITGLADIELAINMFCGNMGIEPSQIGFSSEMSGGLGEGGFMRTSIQTATRSHNLQTGMMDGFRRICQIDTAYRHNIAYPEGEEPYRLLFNTTNSALENERLDAEASSIDRSLALVTLLQTINPSIQFTDDILKPMFGEQLEFAPEHTKAIIDAITKKAVEDDPSLLVDSATNQSVSEEMIRNIVEEKYYNCVEEQYKLPNGEA